MNLQLSIPREREIQFNAVLGKRPELRKLGNTDAAKQILFDYMDSVVPFQVKRED